MYCVTLLLTVVLYVTFYLRAGAKVQSTCCENVHLYPLLCSTRVVAPIMWQNSVVCCGHDCCNTIRGWLVYLKYIYSQLYLQFEMAENTF
jgi:hypothetical protein